MKRPTEPQLEQLAKLARNYPHVLTWLSEWYMDELMRLPKTGAAHVALAQGRCLVLGELIDVLTKSPERPPNMDGT